jgi:hypothetical protein
VAENEPKPGYDPANIYIQPFNEPFNIVTEIRDRRIDISALDVETDTLITRLVTTSLD